MIIAITGTPGTGKSTIAKQLAQTMQFNLIDVNEVAKKTSSKKDGKEVVANLPKLTQALKTQIKKAKNAIIEGHLIVEMKLPLDILLILRCSPKKLEKRLQKRKYSKRKILDNLLCEAQNYTGVYAAANYPNITILEINTTKFPTLAKFTATLAQGGDSVDFSKDLLQLAKRDATTK